MPTKKRQDSGLDPDDLKPEYDLDYSKSRPNPYAGHIADDRVMVLLDADVSQVFTDSESVNKALRALIGAIPQARKRSQVRS